MQRAERRYPLEAQLLVSQQGRNLTAALIAAVGDFDGRFGHPIQPHMNGDQSFSCKQLLTR